MPEFTPNGKARPSAKNSPVLSYLRSSKFKKFFEGKSPATDGFDTTWRNLAQSNKEEFEKDQHDYVQRVYYDVMIANLERRGLDFKKFGPAVQDLVWSTAVQFGPSRTDIFTVPLKDKSELTDKDIVNLVSNYKYANAETFFRSSGPSIISGVKTRYQNEKNDLS